MRIVEIDYGENCRFRCFPLILEITYLQLLMMPKQKSSIVVRGIGLTSSSDDSDSVVLESPPPVRRVTRAEVFFVFYIFAGKSEFYSLLYNFSFSLY